MAVVRMDHVVLVVPDLDAAIAYFTEIGLDVEARMAGMKGDWIDRINAIEGVDVEIVMMAAPDGSGKLELTRFHTPSVDDPGPLPANTMGLRSVMFEVDDVDDTVERLRPHGGQLVGEIVNYENVYRLCYVRGPGEAIIALAQQVNS
jgi:catechol 2,3-dioxygenase-like lactoylglutathione lyase family enzyme